MRSMLYYLGAAVEEFFAEGGGESVVLWRKEINYVGCGFEKEGRAFFHRHTVAVDA